MKKELEDKIVNSFPTLYRCSSGRPCGPISTGDGWFQIIYDLSEKISKEIATIASADPDSRCSFCDCPKRDHLQAQGKCLNVHAFPSKSLKVHYPYNRWWEKKWKEHNAFTYKHYVRLQKQFKTGELYLYSSINKALGLFFKELRVCSCEKYDPRLPKVVQVKEKFSTLRFYIDNGNEKIDELIQEAEKKASETCEVCGQAGSLNRDQNWIVTICDPCAIARNNSKALIIKMIEEEEN